jgi:hypothetical protein
MLLGTCAINKHYLITHFVCQRVLTGMY